jgi:hypothetical protein
MMTSEVTKDRSQVQTHSKPHVIWIHADRSTSTDSRGHISNALVELAYNTLRQSHHGTRVLFRQDIANRLVRQFGVNLGVQYCGRGGSFLKDLGLVVDFAECEDAMRVIFRVCDFDFKLPSVLDDIATQLLGQFEVGLNLCLESLQLLLRALPIGVGQLLRTDLDHSVYALALADS